MPRLLLHVCCGPCALYPARRLMEDGWEVTGLFYNPNIHPTTEYLRRREAMAQAAAHLGMQVIYKDDGYDPPRWLRDVAFREENRCLICYRVRLQKAQSVARSGGFQAFSTSLLYSKRQKHETIATLGQDMTADGGPEFIYQDFREGWKQGIELSKSLAIHRQDYCGCIYSEWERRKPLLSAGASQ